MIQKPRRGDTRLATNHQLLRITRTIADLDNSAHIQARHLNEAINYRMLDR